MNRLVLTLSLVMLIAAVGQSSPFLGEMAKEIKKVTGTEILGIDTNILGLNIKANVGGKEGLIGLGITTNKDSQAKEGEVDMNTTFGDSQTKKGVETTDNIKA